jgi:hypothetical protein
VFLLSFLSRSFLFLPLSLKLTYVLISFKLDEVNMVLLINNRHTLNSCILLRFNWKMLCFKKSQILNPFNKLDLNGDRFDWNISREHITWETVEVRILLKFTLRKMCK